MCSNDGSVGLARISSRVEPKTGKIPLMGRYHTSPRTLQSDYEVTSCHLGSGHNGSVLMATRRGSLEQHKFAVKILKLDGIKPHKLAYLISEVEVFLCMDHPHVARLVDVYESDRDMSLVMECIEGGELFDRVAKLKRFTEQDAALATRQMLLALNYLHSHSIAHRDLKLQNFLYDVKGGSHLKLIDFGFSKFLGKTTRMRTDCGSVAYVAPEVLNKSYTSQCDLWSLGVIVFVLLSGRMPFNGVTSVTNGKYDIESGSWSRISSCAKQFTRGLLEVEPKKRLSSETALTHAWIMQCCAGVDAKIDSGIVDSLRSWSAAPKLGRACASMMSWCLSNEQHAQVRDAFLAMDANHDGSISSSELRKVMVEGFGVPEQEALDAFRALRTSDDEGIHYSEFLAAMMCKSISVDDELLHTTFRKFDTGCSGFITAGDLQDVLGKTFDGDCVDNLIGDADVIVPDGKIDYAEFSQYLRGMQDTPHTRLSALCEVRPAPQTKQACCAVQ